MGLFFFKKDPAPDPCGGGVGGGDEGEEEEGEEGSTLSAIMSFDVGLLASP